MNTAAVQPSASTSSDSQVRRARDCLERQRSEFLRQLPVPLEVRRDRLERGLAMILAHREALTRAVMQDFPGRGAKWTLLAEIFAPVQAYTGAIKNLKRWMRPERKHAPIPFNLFGARAVVQYQPLGVVGIMGAWNGPVNLVLGPLAPVLAAGNRAMLCPSDLMPASAAALTAAVADYFDPSEVAVVSGGLEVSKAFAALPFDHLLFTGNPAVGALVMAAAGPNLVPVTLELGGKCPVVIAPDADLDDAAQRLISTKTVNGGQACIAPDHLFVPGNRLEDLIRRLDSAAAQLYPRAIANADYCALAMDRHYQRLISLIDEARQRGARVQLLGVRGNDPAVDAATRRIALHAIIDPPADTRVMSEELFGPVLLVSTYDNVEEVCAHIRAQPKPLALYVFSASPAFRQFVLDRTFSGGVTLNDTMFHYSIPDLPFGGVGRSGIGAYSYGIGGFRRFSHARSVYKQAGPRALLRVLQPPYGRLFDWVIRNPIEKLASKHVPRTKRANARVP